MTDRPGNAAREGQPPTAPKEPAPAAPEQRPPAVETHEGPVAPAAAAEESAPPQRQLSPTEWVRENLFSTWYDSAVTIVFGAALAYAAYRAVLFVAVTGRWEIIQRNLLLFMVFRFPRDELWRLWVGAFVAAFAIGVAAGVAAERRQLEAELRGSVRPASLRMTARRVAPLLLLLAVVLLLVATATPVLLVAGVVVSAIAGNLAGRRLPLRWSRWTNLGALGGVIAAYVVVTQFGGVGYSQWGGLLLTVFLALGGIIVSFPIGVGLALGRRSSLPAIRVLCVGYIELIRGVPLITLLFMAFLVIGLFYPPSFRNPELVTRALIALVLFTAAYVAEIVRGGLQSVPTGQYEAAQALGLSPVTITRRIVLPQALRAVIPALVGQFISLFKDTSLVFIIGLTDLLGVAQKVTQQPDFLAQGLIAETLTFAGFIYWVGSYTMSRESQRLERRLGVGER